MTDVSRQPRRDAEPFHRIACFTQARERGRVVDPEGGQHRQPLRRCRSGRHGQQRKGLPSILDTRDDHRFARGQDVR